ncbi:MAG: acyl carrier protein [Gammaproteobacteria bacterium]|nr:MAG: acyl carrier protein [Gammaproteobacteria bacterium]
MDDQAAGGEVQERVLKVVKEVLALETDTINLDASITDDLAVNSLDQVTLFLALEDEFNDTIPEEELEQFKTIRNIIAYIKGRVNAA